MTEHVIDRTPAVVVDLWEQVSYTKHQERTERLQVPGGWLYRSTLFALTGGGAPAVAMVFVPERA